jgi:hypothetical protein
VGIRRAGKTQALVNAVSAMSNKIPGDGRIIVCSPSPTVSDYLIQKISLLGTGLVRRGAIKRIKGYDPTSFRGLSGCEYYGIFCEEIQQSPVHHFKTGLEDMLEILSQPDFDGYARVMATCDACSFLEVARKDTVFEKNYIKTCEKTLYDKWYGQGDPYQPTWSKMWFKDVEWDLHYLPNRALVTM